MSRRKRKLAWIGSLLCSCSDLSKIYCQKRKMSGVGERQPTYQTMHLASQDHAVIALPLFNEFLK